MLDPLPSSSSTFTLLAAAMAAQRRRRLAGEQTAERLARLLGKTLLVGQLASAARDADRGRIATAAAAEMLSRAVDRRRRQLSSGGADEDTRPSEARQLVGPFYRLVCGVQRWQQAAADRGDCRSLETARAVRRLVLDLHGDLSVVANVPLSDSVLEEDAARLADSTQTA